MRLAILSSLVLAQVAILTAQEAPRTVTGLRSLLEHQRRACLEGLEGVGVRLMLPEIWKEQHVLLQAEIEQRLRLAGIPVSDTVPILLVEGSYWRTSSDILLRRTHAELKEHVSVERKEGTYDMFSTTWESSLLGVHVVEKVDWESAKEDLLAAVDEFLGDYRFANPPKFPMRKRVKKDPTKDP